MHAHMNTNNVPEVHASKARLGIGSMIGQPPSPLISYMRMHLDRLLAICENSLKAWIFASL